MEAAAVLKMVEDAFRYLCFIIDVIISNNGITVRSVINHP